MKKRDLNNIHLKKLPKDIDIDTGRIHFLLDKCRNKKVLHLGCVDEGLTMERIETGNLLHKQVQSVAEEVYGVDISKEGLDLLNKAGFTNLILGNVEQVDKISELQGKKFDIILASEIIEHLNNPGLFLKTANKLFSKNTIMIITTPNAFRITGLGYKLKGFELIHPDHNFWFSWSTLRSLLLKNNYQVIDSRLYSFTDYKRPLFRNLIKKVHKKMPYSSTATNTLENTRISAHVRMKMIRNIGKYFNVVVRILILRFLYKLNPFFADGLIFIVKPV